MKKLITLGILGASFGFAHAQTTVFDSESGVLLGYGAATANRQLMGQAFNLGNASGPVSLTGLDIALVHANVGQIAYTQLTLEMTIFDTFTPGGAAGAPAFTNPLATITVDFGAQTLAGNSVFAIGNTLAAAGPTTPGIAFTGTPIILSGTSNKGIQFMWRGDTGAGLSITNDLTTAIRGGAGENPVAVGSVASGAAPTFGYFRNASIANPTSTAASLLNSDGRQVGNNSALAFRLYADPVPEPASMCALGLGLAGIIGRRRRAKK